MKRVGTVGRAQSLIKRVLDAGDISLAAAVAELHDVLAVILVHFLAEAAPERNLVVVINDGVVGKYASANCDGNMRRDDRSDAAASKLFFPVNAGLRADAIVVVEPAGNV